MSRRIGAACLAVALVAASACGDRVAGEAPPASAPAPMGAAPDAAHAASAGAPHGDHTPHHGGTVLMERDLHYEIVIEPTGRYAVYFTDAVRADMPASVVSDVAIEVDRQQGEVERIPLAIDAAGECWEGRGAPVKALDASIHVGFTFKGEHTGVDLPFTSYWKPEAAGK
jgi:hypothetical protein